MNAARPPKKTGVLRAALQGMRRTVSGRSRESGFLALLLLWIGDPHADHRRQSYAKSLALLHKVFNILGSRQPDIHKWEAASSPLYPVLLCRGI